MALTVRSSRRRLRPGNDRTLRTNTQSMGNTVRSTQRSQIESDESSYEATGSMGLSIDSSLQSSHSGIFGSDSSSALPNEQALVGHTLDQFANRPMGPTSYADHRMDGYINEPAEADLYGHDPSRLLSALSEAAEHLDYSATTSFSPAHRRSTYHGPAYASSELRYKAPSSHEQFPCRYPGCNEVMAHECSLPYGYRLPLGLR